MPREVALAVIQMEVRPASAASRLQRAASLVVQSAQAGADLVLLPELFNSGYEYSPENFRRAETLAGPTARWMRETSARLQIHLAGSLLLHEQGEIYNALLLFAPDGQMWRYDKRYPWGWERASSRGAPQKTPGVIAETRLGRIGLMICWDVAHPELWQAYAGQIDLLLAASCPPDVGNPTFHLPGGAQVTFAEMGPLTKRLQNSAQATFSEMFDRFSAWLGVPTANSVACGQVRTRLPAARSSLLGFGLGAPWLLRYLPQAERIEMTCAMTDACKILDAQGKTLARLAQPSGEGFALARVQLPENRPHPAGAAPRPGISPWAYLISDHFLPWICAPLYRKGLRKLARSVDDQSENLAGSA